MAKIYLLDDHPMMRDGLRASLEGAGHEVVGESDDPTTALSELFDCGADLAIVDISLRERSGFELPDALQRRDTPIRSIVLTMSAQASSLREAMRLGAAAYILKGSKSIELLNAVDAALRGGNYIGDGAHEIAARALRSPAETEADDLSPRERQVLLMVVDGLSSARIGAQLNLSAKTIETYRSRIMTKLGVSDIPSLVRSAIRLGLVEVG